MTQISVRSHRLAIVLHEASFEEVKNLVIGISKRIEHGNIKTVVTMDHYFIWSWVSEVLLSRYVYVYECDSEDSNLLNLCCRSALANTYVQVNNENEWARKQAVEKATPHFIKRFQEQSFLALGYLVFPLLEGIIKQKASQFITTNGEVVSEFSILKRNGSAQRYKVGKRCSSLRDLLFLFYNSVCSPELKSDIDAIRHNISLIDAEQDPFDTIYQWRNDSLHGFANHQHVAVTLFSLCLVILLHSIKHEYEGIKSKVANESALVTKLYAPWTYYPPY